MEILTIVITLVGHVAWPIVSIILIYKLSPSLINMISNIASHLGTERNLRAKFGNFEIESHKIEINKDELEEIVKESDEQKRLELFKEKVNADRVLSKMNEFDIEWLERFGKDYNIPHAFVVWPHGSEGKNEIDAYNKLLELGLVKEANIPLQGGEYIGMLTEKGRNVINLISEESATKHIDSK